ncbi:MAG: 2-oxoacid:acceptor oxidoreductase subunit alpha [Nitrospirae bacterium]|nr:2-oxoacid:acceptor oxidoreductase subunit alpha [Nitrospirota bacterium]
MDYSIKIGGEAGQGIQTIGGTLAKTFSRSGYHVFTHQDYESRVRGGHNFYQIRFSDKPVSASREDIDILVALDTGSILRHEAELAADGILIYDSSFHKQKHDKPYFLDVPFSDLALEHGGNKVMLNTAATGAILGMLGIETDILIGLIREEFRTKGDDVISGNIKAAVAGHEYTKTRCAQCSFTLQKPSNSKMLITGTEAAGLGAISSGCKFYSAYPMTPSTGIMNYIADKEKEYGIIVEQAEDEISAINMALGASFAGVRAMTGTSGGGFALMQEGVSLAGMTETPIVIALGQRPGPATGLPTRTEQGDLLFLLHSGHGEFPKIVFAPGTPEQAFYLTNKAFELSDKYQVPAFIISDQYLADTQWTYDSFAADRIKYIDRRLRGAELVKLSEYRRHAFTESGISPLAVPGASEHLVVTDSDEHDEEGHIIEDAETRNRMIEKRLFKKMPLIREEISPPLLYGDKDPDILLVGWGSTYGVIKEVVDILSNENKIAMLHFSEIYPFPLEKKLNYLNLLNNSKLAVCIENNATGQFARLIKSETGYIFFENEIKKYDGRPFTLDGLLGEVNARIGRL